ncbi:MAG: AsmA family protein, partial [Candidatus Rokubacteria bacterium]|nr:AsmA family protein [Candidatus Rokubacteria bacterium]
MKRVAKRVLIAIAAVALLAIAAVLALPALVDTPRVQTLIVTSAAQALGRPVRLQSASVRVLPALAVRIRGLEIAEDPAFGATPFLRLDEADLRIHVWPLLTGRVEFGTLVLKKPTIVVIQAPDGRLNVATLGATRETATPSRPGRPSAGGAGAVLGARIRIEDGTVTYEARTAGAGASRYRVEQLGLTLAGAPGPITIEGAARLMPGDLAVKITEASVAPNSTKNLMDARLRGKIALDGKKLGELAAVAMGPSPELAGAVKGTLALGGTLGAPKVTGDVELTGLAVTQ